MNEVYSLCTLIMLQASRVYFDKLRHDGVYRFGFAPSIYHSCVLADTLLYRSLRSLSHLPPRTAGSLMARPSRSHHRFGHSCLGRGLRDSDRRR